MTIEDYKGIFYSLYPEFYEDEGKIKTAYLQMLYYLDSLGHCEFDFENRKVFICKPMIVLLPGRGCMRAVLAGGRDKILIDKIQRLKDEFKDELTVSILKQERGEMELPDVIIFETLYGSILNKLADRLAIGMNTETPTAWIIAYESGNMEEFQLKFDYLPSFNVNWPRRTFDPENLFFRKNTNNFEVPYLDEYTNPISHQKKYMLATEDGITQVDRDWGRYYILNRMEKSILLYDEINQILGVPTYISLPKLLARAATLCSGMAPEKIKLNQQIGELPDKLQMDIYIGVDLTIVKIIANKVGQKLIQTRLHCGGKGEMA
ncbi:hypothetical protein [Geosporobacter ferrireducens]|nr:hypothetical protein [Geosporobacter ferrireducens]MTI55696.1 hypothetical protein [Geosporobacter ferrireducens]